jgi:hypothetical protein
MATNKDIKEIMEARKAARRAIPQVDPAEVVAGTPEPELAGPPETIPEEPATPVVAEPEPAPVEQELKETTKPITGSVVVLEPDDPRLQPVPPDDVQVVTSLKLRRHHQKQLKAEAYYKGLHLQDIIETAVDEYFKKRYGRHKRG